jgi:hypothetical protein
MKRSEIHAGQTVYYAPGSNYMEIDGICQGKAKVLMVAACDRAGRYARRHDYQPVRADAYDYGKAKVLIEVQTYGGRTVQLLVGLGTLRGEYEQVAAAVAERREGIDKQQERERERERRTAEDTKALAARLRDLLGLPQPKSMWDGGHGVRVDRAERGEIKLDRETARKIIELLDAHEQCPLTPSGESAL